MGVKIKKKSKPAPTPAAPTPPPPGYKQKSTEPKEWKLTLPRGMNSAMGFSKEDNFAKFGKQYESDVKSFGWIYIPLARAKRIKTLEVRVIEEMPEE